MADEATRLLFLTRHGEATEDESRLTETGRRQAVLLGRSLREVPIARIRHGPLARAAETARLVAAQLPGVSLVETELAGDYVPYVPTRDELPAGSEDRYLNFLGQFPADDRRHGPELAVRALAGFTGPAAGPEPVHELVVSHNFVVNWLVSAAREAPKWHWLTMNHGNGSLTSIRYAPGSPPSVLMYNNADHLAADPGEVL